MLGESRNRYPEPAGMRGCALGGRDPNEAKPGGNPRPEPFDNKGGGRPCSEPDHHSVRHLIDCTQSSGALQVIAVDGHGFGRAASSTNHVSSPIGETRAAGSAWSPDRARARISRLSAPATRKAT